MSEVQPIPDGGLSIGGWESEDGTSGGEPLEPLEPSRSIHRGRWFHASAFNWVAIEISCEAP